MWFPKYNNPFLFNYTIYFNCFNVFYFAYKFFVFFVENTHLTFNSLGSNNFVMDIIFSRSSSICRNKAWSIENMQFSLYDSVANVSFSYDFYLLIIRPIYQQMQLQSVNELNQTWLNAYGVPNLLQYQVCRLSQFMIKQFTS